MRYLLAICILALPLAAAPKRVPGHVTLVRPILPPKSPTQPSWRVIAPKPTRIVASAPACAHMTTVPVDPGIDANMPRHESRTSHNMPIHRGLPACR